jgi:hypothetical protein
MRSARAASSGVLTLKRTDRLVRDGDTMPRGPDLDLAQAVFDRRLAQILAQRQWPQTHDRMTPFTGARAGQRYARAHLSPRLRDAKHVKVLTQTGEDFEVVLEVTQKDVNELRDAALSVSETGYLRP